MHLIPLVNKATLTPYWQQFVAKFNLQILHTAPTNTPYLEILNITLSLNCNRILPGNNFYIDLNSDAIEYRNLKGGKYKESLARACGLKANTSISILDLTAGFAKDSTLLAALGADITLVEQHPIIAALTQNAIDRLNNNLYLSSIILQDALAFLKNNTKKFDVIYLDPMYPKKNKTAKVKLGMQVIQYLCTEQQEMQQVILDAKKHSKKRIVVKRPKYAPPIVAKPDFSIESAKTRYDVYMNF